jgi:hypothetical protein
LAAIVEVTMEYLANQHHGKLRTDRLELMEVFLIFLVLTCVGASSSTIASRSASRVAIISTTSSRRCNSRLISDFSRGGNAQRTQKTPDSDKTFVRPRMGMHEASVDVGNRLPAPCVEATADHLRRGGKTDIFQMSKQGVHTRRPCACLPKDNIPLAGDGRTTATGKHNFLSILAGHFVTL